MHTVLNHLKTYSTFNKLNQIPEMFLTFDDISCGTSTLFKVKHRETQETFPVFDLLNVLHVYTKN